MTKIIAYTNILNYYNCIQYVQEAREKLDMLSRDMEDKFFKRTQIAFLEVKTMSEMKIQLVGLTE